MLSQAKKVVLERPKMLGPPPQGNPPTHELGHTHPSPRVYPDISDGILSDPPRVGPYILHVSGQNTAVSSKLPLHWEKEVGGQ